MPYIGQKPHNKVVTASEITDGIITADKLASNAVTTAKINADAVTDAKIADDVVGTEHLTAGEVDTTALGADAVTAAKIADNAISEEHLDATIITGLTALGAAPADTDEFLISDAGTLKRMDYSYIKASSDFVKLGETGAVSSVDKIELNNFFSSTYKTYKIFGQNCWGSSAGATWEFQYNTGGSYTALTSGYYYVNDGGERGSSSHSYNYNTDWNGSKGRLGFNGGGSSSYPCMFEMTIDNPAGSTRKNAIAHMGGWDASSKVFVQTGFNHNNNTTAITGIRFLTNTGTLNADNVAIFGLKY
jgi:hypothetical protein